MKIRTCCCFSQAITCNDQAYFSLVMIFKSMLTYDFFFMVNGHIYCWLTYVLQTPLDLNVNFEVPVSEFLFICSLKKSS